MTDTSQDTPLYMYCREPRELGVIRLKRDTRKLGEFFHYVASLVCGTTSVASRDTTHILHYQRAAIGDLKKDTVQLKICLAGNGLLRCWLDVPG